MKHKTIIFIITAFFTLMFVGCDVVEAWFGTPTTTTTTVPTASDWWLGDWYYYGETGYRYYNESKLIISISKNSVVYHGYTHDGKYSIYSVSDKELIFYPVFNYSIVIFYLIYNGIKAC